MTATDQPDFSNPGGNLLTQAQHNVALASAKLCKEWNDNAIDIYHGKFDQWFDVWLNHGAAQAGSPPTPPLAWEVQYLTDPTSGPGAGGAYGDVPIQFGQPVLGSTPVCAALPMPYSNIHSSASIVSVVSAPEASAALAHE